LSGEIKKKFEGYLILNWKTKEMKIAKRKPVPSKINPFQIIVKIEIDAIIPPQTQIVAKGEIIVPTHKVNQMVLEAI
jgi:hypothetical protein